MVFPFAPIQQVALAGMLHQRNKIALEQLKILQAIERQNAQNIPPKTGSTASNHSEQEEWKLPKHIRKKSKKTACPNCHGMVHKAWLICPHCTHKLKTARHS